MDAPDYPVEHFSLMKGLAVELQAIRDQVLRHPYSYHSFGSWWMTIDYQGGVFRLAFDGRDDTYSIEEAVERQEPYQWGESIWRVSGTSHEFPVSAILAFLRGQARLPPK